MIKEITGWHVFGMFAAGFGTIIAVNLTLAINAVGTFPGLEVKNSYVASQSFEADRVAQKALEWDVTAQLKGTRLTLQFEQDGATDVPLIEAATLGRATSVALDQTPAFRYDGTAFVADILPLSGNLNLRLKARAADGTLFQQRIIVEVLK